ncbi:hypothetical protein ACJMK2_035894 [Sinanodonta woodiana]|uniref:Uncharacterized protein n=1 Tax=Sinanodonta woodiana TaxID=1069815 RepID=A0ABD3WFI0_SINWO
MRPYENDDFNSQPTPAMSPKLSRQVSRHQSLRQRRQDVNTDEIIRFVREYQFERQPTLLHLHKKTPLPGIGKYSLNNGNGTHDSGFVDRGPDSNESEDEILDNEVAYIDRSKNPRNDPFIRDMLNCPRLSMTTKDHEILARSLPNGGLNMSQRSKSFLSKQNSFIQNKGRREGKNGRVKHHLPPLPMEDIPDRPSAPSPSHTPIPTDRREFYQETVDYIDPA